MKAREIISRKRLVFITAGIMLVGSASLTAATELVRAGWIEKAVLHPHKFILHAKLDTGAQTSSLNASEHEIVTHDGNSWVRMNIKNRDNESVIIEAPIVRKAKIKRHYGERQTRPVILLDLCIGNVRKQEEVNLVDRTGMNYQLLIGRNFLKGALLVDSGSTYRLSPDCSD